MKALIVCHVGAGLGLGHLARSLVVARALHQELSANVHFLIQGDPVQRDDLAVFKHQFLGLEESLINSIRHFVQCTAPQIIVFDLHPHLIPNDLNSLLRMMRQNGCKAIGVDSLIGFRDHLDLLFIPSFCFSSPQKLPDTAPILFGWDCLLLNVKSALVDWQPGKKILALTGGSDATGLGKTLPVLLNDGLSGNIELHWVIGPYADQPVWPASQRFPMIMHQSPSGLDDLMVESSYAITVYGVSFFELLYYGVPTVVFSPYGNKDDAELSKIAAEGVALVAKDEIEALDKLKVLIADDVLAASLSQQARQKMSVLGGHRFARAVAALIA